MHWAGVPLSNRTVRTLTHSARSCGRQHLWWLEEGGQIRVARPTRHAAPTAARHPSGVSVKQPSANFLRPGDRQDRVISQSPRKPFTIPGGQTDHRLMR